MGRFGKFGFPKQLILIFFWNTFQIIWHFFISGGWLRTIVKVHISVMVELKKKHSELSKKCFESKEQEEKALAGLNL